MFDKKTLTKKEACQYLGIGREQFNSELKKGKISFLTCGKRIKFTVEALERWRSNTTNHIDYLSEVKSTTHTSRLYPKTVHEHNFEKLLEKWNDLKLKSIASKGYMKSIKKCTENKQVSFQQ